MRGNETSDHWQGMVEILLPFLGPAFAFIIYQRPLLLTRRLDHAARRPCPTASQRFRLRV